MWKKTGEDGWEFMKKPKTSTGQPFVVFIGLRNPDVDYFASHPPENNISGDYDYTKKGYQVMVGRFAGPSKHLGFFKTHTQAVKRAKSFMRKHKTINSLERIRLR